MLFYMGAFFCGNHFVYAVVSSSQRKSDRICKYRFVQLLSPSFFCSYFGGAKKSFLEPFHWKSQCERSIISIFNVFFFSCQTRRRYDRAEREFVESKLSLHSAEEKKEMLTEHLCQVLNFILIFLKWFFASK